MKYPYKQVMGLLAGGTLAAIALGGAMAYTADRPPAAPSTAVEEAEKALAAIAARHGTDPKSLLRGMVEQRLGKRFPLKGGVNLVGEDVFVVAGRERNTLLLGEQREEWTGAPRSQSELVVLSGQKVLGSLSIPAGVTARELTAVWFQPDKVFFHNGEALTLGHFDRPKPE